MTLAPLIAAPIAVQIHVVAIILAIVAVAMMPFTRRGSPAHRLGGRAFVTGMAVASLSSFFIMEVIDGSFSLIHLISVFVLVSLFLGWRAARRGNIASHANWMISTAVGGLGIAGIMAFAEPVRRMHQVFLG